MIEKYRLSVKPNVMFVGDLHGNIADFADDIVAKCDNSLIFVAGDIGLGMFDPRMVQLEMFYLEDICRKKDNIVFMIRGNHDDPAFFNDLRHTSKAMEDYLQHVILAPDYSLVETSKGNILCIGGAISIDRSLRDEKDKNPEDALVWFNDEGVKFIDLSPMIEYTNSDDGEIEEDMNPFLQDIKNKNIKIVLSHTGPIDAPPVSIVSPDEVKDLILKERTYLKELGEYLIEHGNNIEKWIYGHFHQHHDVTVNGIEYRMLYPYRAGDKLDVYELH